VRLQNVIYLNGLNGLRAIAAMSVVIAHVTMPGISNFGVPYRIELPMAGNGVTLFFVISGFLITFLLLKEKEKNISIPKFYFRRILRIWPIYYLFIIVCICMSFFVKETNFFEMKKIWWYIFFAANVPFVLKEGILIIAHYWSIGVEEQFYLFWPWLVKLSTKNLLLISILLFIAIFSIKIIIWLIWGSGSIAYQAIMVTRFHCMMVGAIGSILFINSNRFFLKALSNKITQLFAWSIFVLMGLGILKVPAPISAEAISFISLVLIIGQITIVNRIINLELKVFNFIGKISYGIYVVHPLIIYLSSPLFVSVDINLPLKYCLIYSWVIAVTLGISYICYTFYESWFLNLKQKYAVIKSSVSR